LINAAMINTDRGRDLVQSPPQEHLITETDVRYTFAQPNDRNREIILTVLAFDIPTTRQATK